jgi:hypothetical protein
MNNVKLYMIRKPCLVKQKVKREVLKRLKHLKSRGTKSMYFNRITLTCSFKRQIYIVSIFLWLLTPKAERGKKVNKRGLRGKLAAKDKIVAPWSMFFS